ncbi:hypothetical protein B0H34DRAFT_672127 [Crassisporium funariophilum]|nr:hypothetical protein B0H34DRAFT_672127 [Crassisporium funariophilum]
MYLSANSLSLCRKHTATEQAVANSDPLVASKQARQAAKEARNLPPAPTKAPAMSATAVGRLPAKEASVAKQSTGALRCQPSTHIEVVDNEADIPRNTAPSRKSCILEHSDSSDNENDDTPKLIPMSNNDKDDEEDGRGGEEETKETAEAELERLSKEWNSPIYAFFKPIPLIEYIKERRVHVFKCGAKHCMGKSNLRKHAKICWGEEAVAAADLTRDARAACEALGKEKQPIVTVSTR